MDRIVEGRELLLLDGLWGTYHRASSRAKRAGDCIGVLFLNGLYATRAANGDAAVHWAASLAERGYPSFRVDLGGFGDSAGDPPHDWLNCINTGGYAAVVAKLLDQISHRYRLSGIVIAGHCAGAVSAIYAAALSRQCRGLVLMDPYFNMPQKDLSGFRQQINLWARRSHVGGAISALLDLVKQGRRVLKWQDLPANANLKLLRCWKQVASAGIPVLILRAPSRGSTGLKPRTGEFDYLKHVLSLAAEGSRVSVKVVDGANHSFSDKHGRVTVPELIDSWFKADFPTSKEKCVAIPHVSDSHSDAIKISRSA